MDISEIDPNALIQVEFGPANPNWQDVHVYNVNYIRVMESLMTDKLRAEGYLFLNDALRRLNIPRIPAGQLVGWWAPDVDYVELKIDPDSPDDLLVINMQPQGFIWDKL